MSVNGTIVPNDDGEHQRPGRKLGTTEVSEQRDRLGELVSGKLHQGCATAQKRLAKRKP